MTFRIQKRLFRFASHLCSGKSATARNLTLCPDVAVKVKPDDKEQKQTNLRKKFALFMGYRGEKYYGVSFVPGQDDIPTVNREIIKAALKAGYVDESALLSGNSITNASRTDRGVSALRQISVIDFPPRADVNELRQHLPVDIKLFDMKRCTKKLVPFRKCEYRSYLYYIPSYVFAPQDIEMNVDYRMDSATINKIENLLPKFIGTKVYHNFTKGRTYQDPRSRRTIKEMGLLKPVTKDEFELACIRLVGPSFILNQIRKMIGSIIAVVRGFAPERLIDVAFSSEGISIPRAPPAGLMLENVFFDNYNKRFKNTHAPLDFTEYNDQIEKLKDEILSDIIAQERKYELTKLWTEHIQFISFQPYNKEQHLLNQSLHFDDTLEIIRSEHVCVGGKDAAALFI